MKILEYIIKILYYFSLVFAIFYAYKQTFKKGKKTKQEIGLFIFLLILIGIYGIICGPKPYTLDRENYAMRFIDDKYMWIIKRSSYGLYLIYKILHIFTHNENILFFIIPVLYLTLTLIAYNNYEDARPVSLLFLGLSAYGLFGFYMFKQCIAIALIAIFFAYYFKNKRKISLLFIFFAIMFHESALIMIPIYIVLLSGDKSKYIRYAIYFILMFCAIFFRGICNFLVKFAIMIPSLSLQLKGYLSDNNTLIFTIYKFTFLKGMPFFLLLTCGIKNRKRLISKIKNYDLYLLLCFICSITFVMSTYMYWIWRFGAYLYFPCFAFASQLFRKENMNKSDYYMLTLILLTLLALMIKLLCQYYFIYGGIV